jgi:hypothetical protein
LQPRYGYAGNRGRWWSSTGIRERSPSLLCGSTQPADSNGRGDGTIIKSECCSIGASDLCRRGAPICTSVTN